MSLTEKFNMDGRERDQRKKFVRFGDKDIELLRELLPLMEKNVDRIVEDFYAHLLGFTDTEKFLPDDQTVNRLKRTQRQYLLDLCGGVYDENYFERRLQIGVVHERIGLVPKWYIGSYSNFLGLILPYIVRKYRSRPQKMTQMVMALVKIMNLDQQSAMDTYIGTMVEKLQEITIRIQETVGILASTASEISATAEQQEKTAVQQASSASEMATTMVELDRSARQAAEQAEAAAAGSKDALTVSEGGSKTARQSIAGMTSLKEKVGAIADQILRLSEQTGQIGNITNLVTDLANQTHMLALNAAVEAARAGDHGRGFSVVAAEIRKLADQSKKSAERINVLVAEIQKATNATVMATEEGSKTLEQGSLLLDETVNAFHGLAKSTGGAVENIKQVSLNMRQQAVAIKQIVQTMNSLNASSKESAAGITQAKEGIERLNEAAQKLKEIVV